MTDESRSPANAPHDETPADVLGDLWNALDVLPAARSTPNLASSTIEMAAVSVARAAAPSSPARPPAADRWRWMAAGVIVAACLTAGFVTGSAGSRRSPRGPDLMVVIKHLKVLQEAGSVAFLEAFAKGDYLPPMFGSRDSQRRGRSEDGSDEGDEAADQPSRQEPFARSMVPTPELDAALADFRRALLDDQPPPPRPSGEPAGEAGDDADGEPADAATDAAVEFEVNRIAFGELAPSQREAYVALAAALANPQRSDLVNAARLWHAWVAFADPVERAGLVELPTSERLEWLERRMRQWRRFLPGRSGDGDRSEGPPGRGGNGRGPGGPPRSVRG